MKLKFSKLETSNLLFNVYISFSILFLVISNLIAPLLGKYPLYIVLVTVITGLCFAPYLFNIKRAKVATFYSLMVLSCCYLWMLIVIFFHSDYVDITGTNAIKHHLYLIGAIPFFVIVGYHAVKSIELNQGLSSLDKISFFITATILLSNVNFSYFRIEYEKFLGAKSIYLVLGDLVALQGLYYLIKTKSYKFTIYVIYCALTFYVTSRTSMFFFAFVGYLYLLRVSVTKSILLVSSFVGSFLFLLLILKLDFSNMGYTISRMVGLFMGFEDNSQSGRNEILTVQYSDVTSNIFFGNFGGQLRYFGAWNYYIHSALSYVRQFGIIWFSFFISPIFIYVYSIFKRKIKSEWSFNTANQYSVFCMLFIILISAFSRSYMYPHLFIIFGIILRGLYVKSTNDR